MAALVLAKDTQRYYLTVSQIQSVINLDNLVYDINTIIRQGNDPTALNAALKRDNSTGGLWPTGCTVYVISGSGTQCYVNDLLNSPSNYNSYMTTMTSALLAYGNSNLTIGQIRTSTHGANIIKLVFDSKGSSVTSFGDALSASSTLEISKFCEFH